MSDDSNLVDQEHACPNCGERDADRLVWIDDDLVECTECFYEYRPGGPNNEAPPS